VHQSAKEVKTSYETLLELLESIERLLKPLAIYPQIPLTPALDEMIAEIMVELLSTLALTTKEFNQGRSSKSVLTDVIISIEIGAMQRNL
jgi:hypothetical protein